MPKSSVFVALAIAVSVPAVIALGSARSPASVSISPEAKAYLDRAITLFREQHINAAKADWPTLTQNAYATAAGARTTADTYPAIRLIIKELGEKHTLFVDPDEAKAMATGKPSGNALPPSLLLPDGIELANGIGVIRLYGFMGPLDEGKLYTERAQAKIGDMKAHGICRFVLDLRDDTGGNMYPMLNGVKGLLEPGILGTFQTPHGQYASWALDDGVVTIRPLQDTLPVGTRSSATLPVSVLIGPHTGSSGEFTAMSFEGRPNTRFFGAPSAGFVTANSPIALSDGAVVVMTNSWGLDRTGKKYVDRIEPDEETGVGGALVAAVKWLSAQPCPAPARAGRSATRR